MSIISPRVRRSVGATSRAYGLIQKKLQYNDEENESNPSSSTTGAVGTENNPNHPSRLTERALSGISEDERMEEFQSPEEAEELVSRMIEVITPSFFPFDHIYRLTPTSTIIVGQERK